LELKLSKAIINEALSGGFIYATEIPEKEEEIIEFAKYLAEEAQKEYNGRAGGGNETIKAIVELLETSSEETDKFTPDQSARQLKEESGSVSSAFFRDIPLPQLSPSVEGIEMPWNVADLTDIQLRKYHGIMNHYYARARYALAEENGQWKAAVHLRDEALRKALTVASQKNILHETKKPATVLTAEASEDEDFVKWSKKAREHEESVDKFRALTEIYSKNVEVLSREATIRHNEFERSK